jgi:hypothetical protein
VKRGFLSEVLLVLTTDPALCWSKDECRNNVFHIASQEGNLEMLGALLKTIPPRNCLLLLAERNHVDH